MVQSKTKSRSAPPLEEAQSALRAHRWAEAIELFDRFGPDRLEPDDLDGYAQAAWWTGRLGLAIATRERAFAAHLAHGDPRKAAAAALAVANDHGHRLESAIMAGWVRTAERLLEGLTEAREHGLLERTRVNAALGAGDLEAALAHADRVLVIARRIGDRDLEGLGIQDRGRVLIAMGEVTEGLALLDEAIVAAVSGELEPHSTAVVYCNATVACQDLADYRRAGEWAEAAKRWCERQAISGFPGMCRVRRVELMRLRGAWAEAEGEATKACEELREFCLDYAGEGFYQIGEIRLRLGDYAAADQAFREAHELARPPLPGLALLRLAEGRRDEAAELLRRSLADVTLPRLARARLLAADVEVALASGDVARGEADARELGEIAEVFGTHALRAAAAMADGSVALARGDAEAAIEALRRARRLWQETDAPYEAAQAQATLGEALLVAGDREAAALELRTALAVFERLGARPDAERVARLPQPRAAAAPVERRTFMFTDIVESTRLIEVLGDDAWGRLLAWHDRTMRRLIETHGGEEIHHAGDGFFVAFATPREALDCAIEMQRALADHRVEHGFAPRLRIGLHADEALHTGGGYEGRGVHVAARISGLAKGDEILASEETMVAAGGGYPTRKRRAAKLKGIEQSIALVRVLSTEEEAAGS